MDIQKFAKRLEAARKAKKLSQEELGKAVGLSRFPVIDWEAGRKTPDLKIAAEIASCLGVSFNYLIGISDDPSNHRTNSPKSEAFVLSGDVESNAHYDPDEVQVPLIRMLSVCAGYGVDNGTCTPETGKKIPIKRSIIGHAPENAYIALEVSGHSMEPKIEDGSTIVIDTTRKEPSHGDICYVRFRRNGGFEKDVIRFCYQDRDGGIELRAADGSGIPPDYFSKEDWLEGYVQIVGIAVAKLSVEKL